jgi:hypothetical protein
MVANSVYPSRTAEKVSFRELFRNAADVHRNGGTLVGAPKVKDGVILNGVDQYAIHAVGATDLSVQDLSIVVEFSPATAWDDNAESFILDTQANPDRFAVRKTASNTLRIYLGGVIITSVPGTTFGPHWRQNQFNRLVISSTGASTDAWLNGAQILTADASVWPVVYPTQVIAGTDYGTAFFFDGTIYCVDFRAGLLTQGDVDALEAGRLFNYQNRANLWLDMAEATARADRNTELLNDGDMEAPTVLPWTSTNAALSKETASPKKGARFLRVAYNGTANGFALGDCTFVVGQDYCISGWARGAGGTVLPQLQNNTMVLWTGTASTEWQYFEVEFTAIHTGRLWLRFIGSADHCDWDLMSVRPVLAQTLDKSKNGHVCLLGDGATAADIPDFQNPGFGLDGTDQYMQVPNSDGVFNSAAQAFALAFMPDFPTNVNARKTLMQTDPGGYTVRKEANASSNVLQIYLGNTLVDSVAEATYSPYWITNGLNVLFVSAISGATNVWLNGHLITNADATAWAPVDATTIYLWANIAGAQGFNGVGLGLYIWREALSALQVADFMISQGVHV